MSNAFLQIGSGPDPVIVLHGWLSDHAVFSPTYRWLDTRRFSYAFVDAPGYGGARQSAHDRGIQGMGRAALEVADRLDWPRFNVVGHSMGGKAAQWMCAHAQERVIRAVGINPVPASGVPFDEQGRSLFESAAHDASARRAILDMTTGGRLNANWLDRVCQDSFAACSEDTIGEYFRDWADGDFADDLQGNATPFLALAGDTDAAITAEVLNQTIAQWMTHAVVDSIPGAGHYPMLEVPPWLAGRVENFLGAG